MPEISRFYGIIVRMYANDHLPPHFHVSYNESDAQIDIKTGGIIKGSLPPRIAGLVVEWTIIHRSELLENWKRASKNESIKKIKPL